MKTLSYDEFCAKCMKFFNEELKPQNYTKFELCESAFGYNFSVCRINPKTGAGEWVLTLDWYPKEHKGMLYENFESLGDIPEGYGDLRSPDFSEQPPQFVYGYFANFTSALKSMSAGCSYDGRKYKELYY